jgi:hypothetical protein
MPGVIEAGTQIGAALVRRDDATKRVGPEDFGKRLQAGRRPAVPGEK